MIPNHLYGWNVETFIRCVDKTQRRAETYHVEVRIALREETALQTSMDATNYGLLAEQLLVGGYDDFRELGVCLHLPCRVAVATECLCSSQFKDSLDGGAHIIKVGHHVGALTRQNVDGCLRAVYAGDIAGSLHHTTKSFILTDGVDTIVNSLQCPDELLGNFRLDDRLCIRAFH